MDPRRIWPRAFAANLSPRTRGPRSVAVILLLLLLLVNLAAVYPRRRPAVPPPPAALQRQVDLLTAKVQQLQQERRMPVEILNRSRASVGYIYGEYSFSGPSGRSHRTRFSGTGFVIGSALIATNRHVAQPWYEDSEAEYLMSRGARPRLDKLMIFFPGIAHAVQLFAPLYSSSNDLALLHFDPRRVGRPLAPLKLAAEAPVPGDSVVLVGYPMGLAAMVAKSPNPVYRRLAYSNRDASTARELAQLSLIRPSATIGHLGDVVDSKLIYDAVTAQGGSGGPLFNMHGEVIGVNTAYLDGFSGSTLGISAAELQPLLRTAARPMLTTTVPMLTTVASHK